MMKKSGRRFWVFQKFGNKFFRRLFFGFIMLFFSVFVLASGSFVYQNFRSTRMELQQNREIVLLQWADDTDAAIRYLDQVNQAFIATDEFRQYLSSTEMNPFGLYEAYQSYRRLYAHNEIEPGGKIAVLRMGDRLALTPEGTCDIADYLRSIQFPDSILELYAQFTGSVDTLPQFGRIIRSEADSYYITIVQRGRLHSQADYLTFLSLEKADLFQSVSGLDTAGMALLMEGEILAASEALNAGQLEDFLQENPLPDNLDQATYYCREDVYAFKASVPLPMVYVYGGRAEGGAALSAGFLGILAVLLTFGIGGCYLLSRFLYRPVVRLLGKFGGEAGRGGDEFAFLEDVSSKMREDNRFLSATLDKTRNLVRSEALRELLYGSSPTRQLAADDADWLKGPAVVALFCLEQKENRVDWQRLSGGIRSSFASRGERCEFVPLEPGMYAMVVATGDSGWVKEQLVQALSAYQSECGAFQTAVLGTPARFPGELRKSFSSARYVAEYQRLLGQGRYVLTPEDISSRDENYYYPLRLEHDLISFTAQGMERETLRVLDELFEENFHRRILSPEKISLFCFAVAATISRILEILDRSPDIFGENTVVYLELKLYDDTSSLCRKILELFGVLLQEASGASWKQEYTMANQLIAYVRENYDRDLSLTDLSEKFNMSQGYISTLFKNLAGANFKDYLSRLRFEKAVEILEKNPFTQTKDLAAMIGLNTPKAVIALFNKYAGMSPRQYVSTHLNV